MKQNNMLAMILAGGRGSRLHDLTKKVAKPAVSYGGKYRIIDFPLSNCANSGIDVVGVLTQYESVLLNSYVAAGRRWGLDAKDSGVYVLPPREKADANLDVYRGTADAISQNIDFIDSFSPEYLLILSGDHIYKMDYSKMLDYHKEKDAACTIAMLEVPWEEASRFGLMLTDDDNRITEFEEKPKNPRSNKASMGVYIFTWAALKKYLIADEADPNSKNDFGKNVIPAFLRDGRPMYAYPFEGYWKDVGTLGSLWDANMDLLDPKDPLDMRNPHSKIYARNYASPSTMIAPSSKVSNSFITEGCRIKGTVENSVIYTGCEVEEGAVVSGTVLMPNTIVRKGSTVSYAIVGEQCVIEENVTIGARPEDCLGEDWGISVVGHKKTIPSGTVIKPKEIV